MNKTAKNLTAIGLCAVITLSGVGAAFAQSTDKKPQSKGEETKAAGMTQTAQQETGKDETVYVLAGADGSVQRVIVSDWVKNAMGSSAVIDRTELSQVENVGGDEGCATEEDGTLVWDAQGNDLYYQGDIEKELPVGMTVSYTLDGRTVLPQELAGRSGRVVIRFDYENRQYSSVLVGGRRERLCVPFVTLTGMLLDNESFRNVTVSSGRIINDGDHTIVVGMAFPGLQENLDLSRDTLDIPDYVEITADVTDFAMGMTITVATNEIFSGLDREKLDTAGDLTDSLDELTDAMEQLIDGSSELCDGLCTLLEKSDELADGVDELTDGAKKLRDGATSLNDGTATLRTKLGELSSGLTTLSGSSASLNNGAEQVFNTLLSAATQQARAAGIEIPSLTIDNYSEVLTGVIASLDDDAVYQQVLQQVTAAVEEKRPQITTAVTTEVRRQVTASVAADVEADVTAQVLAHEGLTQEQYDNDAEIRAAVDAAAAVQMQSGEVQTLISTNVEAQMSGDDVRTLIAGNTEAQVQQAIADSMSSDEVQSQLSAASAGAKSVIALKTSLDSYNAFYLGLLSYTGGVDTAAVGAAALLDGAAELKDGTKELKDGAAELYSGVLTMQESMPELLDGVTELRDGSVELSDGLCEFDEQGIQKVVELLGDDLESITARLQATIDVAREYRSFAGISDGVDGQVKFIYRTDEISAD